MTPLGQFHRHQMVTALPLVDKYKDGEEGSASKIESIWLREIWIECILDWKAHFQTFKVCFISISPGEMFRRQMFIVMV